MGNILKRKDNTSIFCSQLHAHSKISSKKIKFTGIIIAFSLMALGTWIIILAN
jgi:hypothetical protein